jgi:hypothetical protein
MRHLLLLLTSLAALAGCDAGGGPAPLPGPHATASFPPGSVVNVIRVDVLDRLPLRAAALVAPDGTQTEASWLDVNDKVQASGGQFAMSSPWRGASAFAEANPALLPTANAEATFYSQKELLLMSADADIALPDPVVYRRDWQNYRVRLSFGAPGALVTRDIPAPQPPPG